MTPAQVIPLAFALVILGCTSTQPRNDEAARAAATTRLFDAVTVLDDDWQQVVLAGKTEYQLAISDNRVAIRAVGKRSASGLIRRVAIDPHRCPIVTWSWSVTKLQNTADLSVKALEDVAASIFLLFGDPGMLFDPKPVPTLRYVWTNQRAEIGAIIDSPYLPGTVRSLVLRRGIGARGQWVSERRNIVADFTRAFGYAPTEPIQAVILFTDNDQTKEPVEAFYGRGRAVCGAAS